MDKVIGTWILTGKALSEIRLLTSSLERRDSTLWRRLLPFERNFTTGSKVY